MQKLMTTSLLALLLASCAKPATIDPEAVGLIDCNAAFENMLARSPNELTRSNVELRLKWWRDQLASKFPNEDWSPRIRNRAAELQRDEPAAIAVDDRCFALQNANPSFKDIYGAWLRERNGL